MGGESSRHDQSSRRFAWYELLTTDMTAAKAFYHDVVGWTRAMRRPRR